LFWQGAPKGLVAHVFGHHDELAQLQLGWRMDGTDQAKPVTGAASIAAVGAPRLTADNANRRHLAGVAGRLLAQPWLDHLTLQALKRGYFPLSRLWAAAGVADGATDAFWAASGMPRRHEQRDQLVRVLAQFDEAKVTAAATDAAWERVFFGRETTSDATRVAIETARHNRRDALNKTRRLFLPLISKQTPRVRLSIDSPAEVAARYDAASATDAVFAAPAVMPDVQVSQSVPGISGDDHWLRFKSPSATMADTCYARVHTPDGIANPPTVILGHGICVDFDHWHGLIDESQALLARGIRVIRPEAPWHGRRTPAGYYAGERAIGTFPTGMLDLMVAAVREWSVLAAWARTTSDGPLAFAGTSLGALTAQLAASVSHAWPEPLKPEALYLITHAGNMSEGMITGAVSTLFAEPEHAVRRGWTPELVRRHAAMIDPVGPPVMPADRIVSVLGSRDVITPFDGGETLVRRWGIPPENVFISANGHFTIPMRLLRVTAPTDRFAMILNSLA
jgi:Alpha/beta hydrolase domain containing 18